MNRPSASHTTSLLPIQLATVCPVIDDVFWFVVRAGSYTASVGCHVPDVRHHVHLLGFELA